MTDEIAFIGDVHGCAAPLRTLLESVTPLVGRIVMLGDYVNRGAESREVIEILLELRHSSGVDCTFLSGNHDKAFLRVLSDPALENNFLRMGGAATVRSYIGPPYHGAFQRLRASLPADHVALLESLEESWNNDSVYAAHEWHSNETTPPRYVVAGHSVQRENTPSIGLNVAYIDTGCGTRADGRLTAFLWPSKEWIQADAPLA